jgi:hypothetical protein
MRFVGAGSKSNFVQYTVFGYFCPKFLLQLLIPVFFLPAAVGLHVLKQNHLLCTRVSRYWNQNACDPGIDTFWYKTTKKHS